MTFPIHRYRRLRQSEGILRMVRETSLTIDDLIEPFFVCEGSGIRQEISSMPGVFRLSIENLVSEVKESYSLGIPAVILFGIPNKKDELGSEAYKQDGIIQRAILEIKNAIPEMDGRVQKIRATLDETGHQDKIIMSYAAKFASAFYGPFREAADSSPQFGDRCSYQMDPANTNESIKEVLQDIEEGADIVMVKPALSYLDIISKVRSEVNVPVAAYNVSGEYSMVKAASQNGWVDGERVMMEVLISIQRAGAHMILTYFSREAARLLNR